MAIFVKYFVKTANIGHCFGIIYYFFCCSQLVVIIIIIIYWKKQVTNVHA